MNKENDKNKKSTSRWIPFILCFSIIFFHVLFFTPQRVERLENFFYDMFFRIRPPLNVVDNIAYIEVAEDSIQVFGRWPWERHVHAVLLHILSQWKAKAAVFDIVFSEPSNDFDDGAFEEGLEEASHSSTKVYLPLLLDSVGKEKIWVRTLPRFQKYAQGIGHMQITPDQDGLIRRIKPVLSNANESYPHLALQVAFDLLPSSFPSLHRGEGGMRGINLTQLPLDEQGNFIVNWSGKWHQTFHHYSYVDVMRSFEAVQKGEKPIVSPEKIRNKICIIGVTATGLTDIKATPVESTYPAVGLYGNIINSVLNKQFIKPIPGRLNTFILIVLGLIATLCFVPFRHILSFARGGLLIAGWLMAAFGIFWKFGIWMYVFQQILLILVLFLFSAMFSFFFIEQEKTAYYKLATHDGLTGLFTSRHFHELLNEAIPEALNKNESMALLMLDIDNFKKCNDTYGHQMGDEVIKAVSRILNSLNEAAVEDKEKDQCLAGRYGGEEMIILIRRLKNKEQALQYAEWIRQSVEHRPVTLNDKTISATLSAGVAVLRQNENSEKLIQRADKALYQAKFTGKNRVCLAEE